MSTILAVDDNPLPLTLIETMLTFVGHDVIQASDGHKALETLSNRDVDLVITDIDMPGMGGIGLLKKIRQKDLFLPVIAVSRASDPPVLQVGFDAFIPKPFNIDILLTVVESVLRKKTAVSYPEKA